MPPITDSISKAGFDTSSLLPKVGMAFNVIIVLIFAAGLIFLLWYGTKRRGKYKINLEVWEKVNGTYEPVRTFKAGIVNIGSSQFFEIPKLKKKKIPRGTKKTGNRYMYFISPDGNWLNIGVEDLDFKARHLKINLDNAQVTLSVNAAKKLLQKDYGEPSNLLKYLPAIMLLATILIFGIIMMLMIKEYGKAANGVNAAAETAKTLTAENRELLKTMVQLLESYEDILKTKEVARITSGGGV